MENRVVKFRGMNTDGEWLYGDLIHQDGLSNIVPVDGSASIEDSFVMAVTVGQFTGLKDKNGKEIYEGDIVKCTDGADKISELNSDTGIGKIEWLEEWGFWNISNIENGLGDISYNGYVEVIGNIYENP